MTYNKLKQLAQPHIREGENLPSNAFLLLNQLHIPFKNKKQCEEDYGGKMTPLDNHPAFLSIDSTGNKTVYFNSNTKYWNFYIFHEIAHYILGHEDDCPQNEIDADMLACILAAPIENLPSTLKSARDLSVICKIPIDKAEMYWQEIKYKRPNQHIKLLFSGLFVLISLIIIIIFSRFGGDSVAIQSDIANIDNIENSYAISDIEPQDISNETASGTSAYYMTSSGTHYHKAGCQYIKYKTNVISITFEEVKVLNLEACNECIS